MVESFQNNLKQTLTFVFFLQYGSPGYGYGYGYPGYGYGYGYPGYGYGHGYGKLQFHFC